MHVLQPAHRAHQGQLDIEGQAGGYALRIDLVGVEALRLDEDLVAVLAGETMDLVFDRRAVARSDAFDDAGEHRRAVQPGSDDVVGPAVGVGDPAGHLARMLAAIAEEGKHRHRIVAGLFLQQRIVDAAAVEPGRRAGLEAADRQPDFLEAFGQRNRRRITEAPGAVVRQADMDQAIEEGAGGEHHGGRLEADAELRHDPGHPVTAEDQVVRRLLEQRQVRLVFEAPADRLLVELPVGLGAGGPYRWAFGGIQDAELDARLVGRRRHRTTQGIDLLDQMALADAADRGIAGHRAKGFDVVREQQRARTGTRRREGGFGAGMAAANHDHIKGRGKLHWLRSSENRFAGAPVVTPEPCSGTKRGAIIRPSIQKRSFRTASSPVREATVSRETPVSPPVPRVSRETSPAADRPGVKRRCRNPVSRSGLRPPR